MNFIGLVNDFRNLGCKEQSKCATAARVYADLILDKCNIDICKYYDPSLNVVYLRAHATDRTSAIILPTLDSQAINLKKINEFHKKLSNTEQNNLILAVCDTSSIILYYNLKQLLNCDV